MAATHVARVLTPMRAASRRLPLGGGSLSVVVASRTAMPATGATGATWGATGRLMFFHAHARTTGFPAPSRPRRAAAADTPAEAETSSSVPEMPDANGQTTAVPGPTIDWSASFHGLSTEAFSPELAAKLMTPLDPEDVEVKPDGIIYLPEIKYRRILNGAFGPGGWGLAPRGELVVGEKVVSREYALVVQGRFVGQARGECPYFGEDGVSTAGEGCKSNALMRCCKDIGIASELWDPRFIRQFRQKHCREVWVEHVATKKRRQIWLRKDCPPVYPYALASSSAVKMVR